MAPGCLFYLRGEDGSLMAKGVDLKNYWRKEQLGKAVYLFCETKAQMDEGLQRLLRDHQEQEK